MEALHFSEHEMQVITGFCVLLALNIVIFSGKFLFKLFEKKSDKNDKTITEFHKKIETLNERMANTDGQMEHLMNVITSYMENTINYAEKLGAIERQFDNFSEKVSIVEDKFSEFAKFDDDMRRFSSAIKWLAGNRWEELREAIIEDEDLRR